MSYAKIDPNLSAQAHAKATAVLFWPAFERVLNTVSERDKILPGCLEAVWSEDSFIKAGSYAGIWFQTFREEFLIGFGRINELDWYMTECEDILTAAHLNNHNEEQGHEDYCAPLYLAKAMNYFRGARKKLPNQVWKGISNMQIGRAHV